MRTHSLARLTGLTAPSTTVRSALRDPADVTDTRSCTVATKWARTAEAKRARTPSRAQVASRGEPPDGLDQSGVLP